MPYEDVFKEALGRELDCLRTVDQYRYRRAVRVIDSTHVEINGRRFINFASNNYLGLTHHPRVREAAIGEIQRGGLGSGAAPLVTGYSDVHAAAEAALALWKGTEDAVILPSGYQANLAAIQTLAHLVAKTGGRFLVDKLAHASLIDAVRTSDVPFRIFPHNNLTKLSRLLSGTPAAALQVVVTESIFSMDGDAADLDGLARLKHERPFVLYLDDAHGSGVYGPAGAGYAAELGLGGAVDVGTVTFSKAMGCIGGAVCGSRSFCEMLVNTGRAYLFSTSLPAAMAAAVIAAIAVFREQPDRARRVRELAQTVREAAAAQFEIPAGNSPIIPLIIGTESDALAASALMYSKGLLMPAIRPPTVPRGGSRLRITLSCDHTDAEIEKLISAFHGLKYPEAK